MGKKKDKKKVKDRATRARDAPDWGSMRPVTQVRGDYTLRGSEAIYSAVSRIANSMAMLPIHLYKNHEIQVEDWRERLVNYQPNATMIPFIFQQTMEAIRNTEGAAYALMVPDESDPTHTKVESLDILDASQVQVLRDPKTRETFYAFRLEDGTQAMVHESSMIVLRYMSTNGEKGIRPIDVLMGTLDYGQRIREYASNQLSGVNSGVVLNIPGTNLSPGKRDEAIKQFLDAYKKSGGRVMVLEGGMTATTLTQSPVDAKSLDVERVTKNRVATVYNIPPHMLGDYSDSSYSTNEQSTQEFLTLTITPIVTQWEQQLNLKLLTWREYCQGYRFRFDLDALLRADQSTQADVNAKGIRSGYKLIDEVRQKEGKAPVPGGSIPMISKDLAPLEAVQNGTTQGEPTGGTTP